MKDDSRQLARVACCFSFGLGIHGRAGTGRQVSLTRTAGAAGAVSSPGTVFSLGIMIARGPETVDWETRSLGRAAPAGKIENSIYGETPSTSKLLE